MDDNNVNTSSIDINKNVNSRLCYKSKLCHPVGFSAVQTASTSSTVVDKHDNVVKASAGKRQLKHDNRKNKRHCPKKLNPE